MQQKQQKIPILTLFRDRAVYYYGQYVLICKLNIAQLLYLDNTPSHETIWFGEERVKYLKI